MVVVQASTFYVRMHIVFITKYETRVLNRQHSTRVLCLTDAGTGKLPNDVTNDYLLYPLFVFVKKGILIPYLSRSVVRLSVRLSVCPSVVSCKCISPKRLGIETSNFAGA